MSTEAVSRPIGGRPRPCSAVHLLDRTGKVRAGYAVHYDRKQCERQLHEILYSPEFIHLNLKGDDSPYTLVIAEGEG
jgi:hypothetical protein